MRATDRVEFVRVLEGLAAIKPGAKLTPESLALWWASMSDWSIEEFKRAAARLAKSIEFFPNPYHFEQLRKSDQPTAAEAFMRAREIAQGLRLGRHGDYVDDGVSSGNPAIDRAVRSIGGYTVIAMRPLETMHFLEKRFSEHYETGMHAIEDRIAIGRSINPSLEFRPVGKLLQQITEKATK